MTQNRKRLFAEKELRSTIEAQVERLAEHVSKLEDQRILNTSIEDLVAYFVGEYFIEPIKLHEDAITTDIREVQVDVSGDPLRAFLDRSGPHYVSGTEVSFVVPFEGDPELFRCRPSQYAPSPLSGHIGGGRLILSFQTTSHDATAIRSEFDRDLTQVKQHIKSIETDLGRHNDSIGSRATTLVESRRKKLIRDQALAESFGFPLHMREGAPTTYAAPEVRRRIRPGLPQPSSAQSVPEPILEMNEYEHILSVISSMVHVIERSPAAFRGMNEEHLRQHFLVQLNGQYEGQATGETFNFAGKTDIIIRANDKNIFIAECKFWNGPASLTNAINQLLGYASWRDTKTALLVFNRGREFSSVIDKIRDTVEAHPSWKRTLPFESERGCRVVLRHPEDERRELIMTALAFEVPGVQVGDN